VTVRNRRSAQAVLRAMGRPSRWRDGARELAWAVSSRRPPAAPPTWTPDPAALRDTVLRWPRDYGWAGARPWVHDLGRALGTRARIAPADIAQPYDGIVVFEWSTTGGSFPIAIDYGDFSDVDSACAGAVALYFKMQHRRGGYGLDNVVPGGFVPSGSRMYPILGRIRDVRDRRRFAFDVYGRFSLHYAPEVRGRAVALLDQQSRFGFEGGLRRVGYGEALHEAARARVCLDLPGRGTFCHRLVEYLAVGACVVSPEPDVELHVPLVDGESIAYAAEDLSDLVDLCERYVRDDAAREAMAGAARDFFDRYLHRDQLAGYYLERMTALR
jgi:Glycosyl transferases group 1